MGSPENNVSCGNCVGACCRANTGLELTLKEASYMLRAGNRLETLHQPVDETGRYTVSRVVGVTSLNEVACAVVNNSDYMLTKGHGLYKLKSDCVFLEAGTVGVKCTAYDQRPGICQEFEAGAQGCLDAREMTIAVGRFPDWEPIELTSRPS